MHLSERERDRLLVYLAARLARERQARGLRLTYPEAMAILSHEIGEGARDGRPVADLMAWGRTILTAEDVLPGVAAMIDEIQVEATFPDGTKLVTVHGPIPHDDVLIPGEVLLADGPDTDIVINAGRATVTLTVRNTGDRPVQIGSHYHFAEVNAALTFDRAAARGHHLDISAGTAVRFEPGEERTVDLVAYGGAREVHGFTGAVDGPLDAPGDTPGDDATEAAR